MLLNAGCNKKSTHTRIEYVLDTVKVSVPARKETLYVDTGTIINKDTVIVQYDTLEKVRIKLVKMRDTIRIDCECDSLLVSSVDTVKIVKVETKVIEKKRRISTIERIAVIGFFLIVLLWLIRLIR
jgi:hypothetical protein